MKTENAPLFEITATDADGIAMQQQVIDAFNEVDKTMDGLDASCAAMHKALDLLGAPPLNVEQFIKDRDEIFAEQARKRQLKENKEA